MLFALVVGLAHTIIIYYLINRYRYEFSYASSSFWKKFTGMLLLGSIPILLFTEYNVASGLIIIAAILSLVIITEENPSEGEPLGTVYIRGWSGLMAVVLLVSVIEMAIRTIIGGNF